jgi:hypothetical protein
MYIDSFLSQKNVLSADIVELDLNERALTVSFLIGLLESGAFCLCGAEIDSRSIGIVTIHLSTCRFPIISSARLPWTYLEIQ